MTDLRIAALRRFATAISILTCLGHAWFGFEQAVAHVFASLAAAYGVEIALEVVDARACRRPTVFRGGVRRVVDFLLPAHITGLACAMLLYPNDRLGPVMFAAAFGIASKHVFRARIGNGRRHFMNPSNAGIAMTLLAFPWVGVAMPYEFTENLRGSGDWILPVIFVCVGSFLNARFTRRIPLIAAWVGTFALQAVIRSLWFDFRLLAALAPMSGVAFVLFTFYMVPDPGTTPTRARDQIWFGAAVAIAYGALQVVHVVYGLFFALAIVCSVRGCALLAREVVAALRSRVSPISGVSAANASMPGAGSVEGET